ncbi:hypothetical protein [Inquilinus sp.]|uniref:hypothetical protein n=1 Tax=Inquilinus sp. TaxID=1932117 RepID=UPI0031DCD92E
MPRDANGTYTKPAGTTAVTGQVISSSAYNNLANDEADALTDSLSRSGKGGMQADLNMGGKKVTNVGNSSASSDAVRRDQAIAFAREAQYGGVSTGSANAHAITLSPTLTTLPDGLIITFRAGFTNTGATTLDVNGLGGRTIRREDGTVLQAGDIVAGGIVAVLTNNTSALFILLNPRTSVALGTAAARDVGTGAGNLPEITNGSGQFDGAVDAAHKALDNLTGAGIQRTTWASIAFTGAGSVIAAFNGAGVTRNGVGLYTITFPSLSGSYRVSIDTDVPVSATGNNANVVSGSRTATSVQIATMQGNSGMSAFDPDRVTVTISRIA